LISGPNQSLFKIENKPNLAQVPTFLGSGDVVLGFVHLPPYSIEDDELTVPPVSLINRVMDKVFDRFQTKIDSQLKAVGNEKTSVPKLRQPSPSDGKVGLSSFIHQAQTVKTKKDKDQKVFYSIRIGIVDVGFAGGDAVAVWPEEKIRRKVLKLLSQVKNPDVGFGPQAVAFVRQNLNSQDIKEIGRLKDYLQAVGRELAYDLLHEFWHAAELTGEHPYEGGNIHIEGTPSGTKPDLVFQPKAIQNILASYEKTWCKDIEEGRISVGDLKV